MFEDPGHEILINGLAAAKAKEYDLARHYLEWYLRLEPPFDQRMDALMALVEISTDPAEQRSLLDEALVINPSDPRARRHLAILQGKLDPAKVVNADRLPATPQGQPAPSQIVDAGSVGAPVPTSDQDVADSRRFTCPNCSGRMVFTPDGEGLVCEYCAAHPPAGSTSTAAAPNTGQDFTVAMATAVGHLAPVKQRVLTCKGCGAVFILPPQELTLTCPYCESNYVLEETRELVAPGRVIPFKVNAQAALQALRAWLDGLHLKPPVKVAKGHGLYLPAWSFTIDGQVDWHCQIKMGRNEWTGQDEWEQRDDLELLDARDLLIAASQRLPEACRPALLGYDLQEQEPYSDQYLANWPAETYQETVSDASLEARERVFKAAQGKVKNKLMLDQVRNLSFSSMGLIIETYNLVLLPAWLTSYTAQDLESRRYDVLVNGQTGAVTGDHPPTGLAGFLDRTF
jgi:DNA-directed RNA polymerase subunit RPC12/RpoP